LDFRFECSCKTTWSKHNKKIKIESTSGFGSTFSFVITSKKRLTDITLPKAISHEISVPLTEEPDEGEGKNMSERKVNTRLDNKIQSYYNLHLNTMRSLSFFHL